MSGTNQINSQLGGIELGYVRPNNVWERFTNGTAQTTLNGSITNSQTLISVVDASGFPGLSKFRIRIGDELMLVTLIGGNDLVVTRGIEGTTAVSHSNGDAVDFEITAGALDAFRNEAIQYGHDANLPDPGDCKEGMVYITDDSLLIYRHNGVSWDSFGPNYCMSPPKLSDFAWVNQGSALTDGTNGVVIFNFTSASSTLQLHVLKKAAPSTPYRVAIVPGNMDVFSQYWSYGVCIRNNSSGKIIAFGPMYRDTGGLKLDINKWDSATSFNSSYYTLVSQMSALSDFMQTQMWYSIKNTGSQRTFEISYDGINWLNYNTGLTSTTDFMTEDEVGFYVLTGHATLTPTVNFLHWSP